MAYLETETMTNHIRYKTGDNPICEKPLDVPQYFLGFDLEPGPHCQTCFSLMQAWLNWWIDLGRKSEGLQHIPFPEPVHMKAGEEYDVGFDLDTKEAFIRPRTRTKRNDSNRN